MIKKVAMLLAEGFEEIEAVVPADVLRRLGFELVIAGISKEVNGSHGICVRTDCLISDLKPEKLDALILPGGMPGSTNLRDNPSVSSLIKKMHGSGRIVAALCAAPIALNSAGILNGKKITSHPSVKGELSNTNHTGMLTELDGNIITGKGPGASFEFACRIAEALGKKNDAVKLMNDMFVSK